MFLHRKPQGDHVYTMRPPDYQEKRGDRRLLVWSDIPHWVIVDNEFYDLLCELDGKRSIEDIFAVHPDWAAMRADVIAGIAAMESSGVVTSANARAEMTSAVAQQPIPIENVSINITRRCNLRCKFCYNHGFPSPDAERELSAKEIWHFLRGLKRLLGKRPSLAVLGGEPLLRPDDLLTVSMLARRAGFDTLVSTNGTLVTDSFARQAALIGLHVQVSLDGHCAELHDAVRGAGSFSKTIEGIETLVGRNVHTIISMVCHRENLHHLEEFYDLAVSLGVDEARFIPLKMIGGGVDGGFVPVSMAELMRVSFDLFKRRPELLKLAGRDAFSIMASTCRYSIAKKTCGTGLQTFLLDSDGSIYPCLNTNLPEFRLGSIRDAGFNFQKMWQQSSQLGNFRKQTAVSETSGVCSGCIVRHWCVGGCRGETYVTTGSIEGRPQGCEDMRETIIEMMWMISERPDIAKPANTAC